MIGRKTQQTEATSFSFDYAQFLCRAERSEWKLSDVFSHQISGLMQWLNRGEPNDNIEDPTPSIAEAIYRTISPQFSDKDNLLRLIEIARERRISCLNIYLPYPLDDVEVADLVKKSNADIRMFPGNTDTLKVCLEVPKL
ncbi:hypothetical protein [Veronia pacifica]|uniref:Transporter n=1 Tax=Veronia pacifica TaxID=1080227 RepID=A0A1C3EDZ0_9GAMM|nr:hypothetical protein [Veronia pacifica]ODA31472.1 hypothetical protein A8L45_16950 [Veronia pacifica]